MKNILWMVVALSSIVWADFVRDENGIVTDTEKHLQWQDDSSKVYGNWKRAIAECEELALGGFEDWRLPNINELISITNYSYKDNITEKAFNTTGNVEYWSSTSANNDPVSAWYINFGSGHSANIHKSMNYKYRCVRTVAE